MESQNGIGVIIGRFQTDELHAGHLSLINEVIDRHSKVIVLIGSGPALATKENPLDYPTRELMIQSLGECIVTAPLPDFRSDQDWSENVDRTIRAIFPIGNVILYGSRKSFVEHYRGAFKTVTLPKLEDSPSSTDIRTEVGGSFQETADFRRGVIYSTQNRYPIMYHTIDVAVIKGDALDNMEVLMGTKYGDGQLRLIGGFVDRHETLEDTCRREVSEEAGISVEHDLNYIGSYAITDWRYARCSDKIVSSFFWTRYTFGRIVSGDDLDNVQWYNLKHVHVNADIGLMTVDSHIPMIKDLYIKLREDFD